MDPLGATRTTVSGRAADAVAETVKSEIRPIGGGGGGSHGPVFLGQSFGADGGGGGEHLLVASGNSVSPAMSFQQADAPATISGPLTKLGPSLRWMTMLFSLTRLISKARSGLESEVKTVHLSAAKNGHDTLINAPPTAKSASATLA